MLPTYLRLQLVGQSNLAALLDRLEASGAGTAALTQAKQLVPSSTHPMSEFKHKHFSCAIIWSTRDVKFLNIFVNMGLRHYQYENPSHRELFCCVFMQP